MIKNNLIIHTKAIREMKEYFSKANLSISTKESVHLLQYQQKLLSTLEWVEMDSHKLETLLDPFITCIYLNPINSLSTFKQILTYFYTIRKQIDYHCSDEDIIHEMFHQFSNHRGNITNSFLQICLHNLQQQGGLIRDELFSEY